MSGKQMLFLVGLGIATWVVVSWVSHQSKAPHNYRWFINEIPKQQQTNRQLELENHQMRRKVMALRYDHRTIAREVRDRLTLFKKGEWIVHLPPQ